MNSLRILLPLLLLVSWGALAQEAPTEKKEPEVVAPKLKAFVNADYPPDALAAGVEASVVLKLEISAEGKVTAIEVLTPAGQGFDEAAVAAVGQMEFEPATRDGKPMRVRIQFVYHFKLEKKEVDTTAGQDIEGVVKERGVGLPVVGAEVAIKELDLHASTDAKGKFGFINVLAGKYTLIIIHPEYRQLEQEIEVQEGQVLQVTLGVDLLNENPYETVVVGKREDVIVTKYVLEQRTLETVPGTFGDPVRVVETLPGAGRSAWGLGQLIIRGSQPNESKAFIDGVQIPLLYHFLGGPSVLNPEFLESIDYFPGNFPSRFGGALGGIIEVNTKTTDVEQWGGELDINLLNVGGYLEGNIGDSASLRLGARRSYVDGVILAALEIAGESGTTVAPVYYDYQAELDYKLDQNNRLRFLVFGSYDSLELVTTDEQRDLGIDITSTTSFLRLVPSWVNVGQNYSLSVKPYFGWDSFSIVSPGVNLYVDGYLFAGRAELKWKPSDWLSITAGLDGMYYIIDLEGDIPVFNNYYTPGADVLSSGPDKLNVQRRTQSLDDGFIGGYAEFKFEPVAGVMITPGFRSDYLRYSGRNNYTWDPRLVVRYKPLDWMAVKAGFGKFSQEPDFGSRNEEYGNPDLEPQWALHASGGFEMDFGSNVTLDLAGFFVRRYDLVAEVEVQDTTGMGIETTRALNRGDGQSYGMEVILKHKPSDWFYGWVAYTLSRTELWGYERLQGPGGGEGLDPSTRFVSPYDQTHILSVVASFRLGRGWETGLRLRYVTGSPTTGVEQGVFIGDISQYKELSAGFLETRLPDFFQIDFRVEKKWVFDSWELGAYLDVQNVTNQANTEFISWDYRFRESWNVPGIPLFPSIGVNGRF